MGGRLFVAEVPEIEDTGSTGGQEKASAEIISPAPRPPFRAQPIAETVQGLAASKHRSFGGEIAANILAAAVSQTSAELADAKQELKETRRALDAARAELAQLKTDNAVLGERVRSGTNGRHLRNTAIAGGTALIGIAIELNRSGLDSLSLLIGGIALALVLMGWFWPQGAGA